MITEIFISNLFDKLITKYYSDKWTKQLFYKLLTKSAQTKYSFFTKYEKMQIPPDLNSIISLKIIKMITFTY